jgi:hypothetical protein
MPLIGEPPILADRIGMYRLDPLELDEVEGKGRQRESLAIELEKCLDIRNSFDTDVDVRYFRKAVTIQERTPLPNPQGAIIPLYHPDDSPSIGLARRKSLVEDARAAIGLLLEESAGVSGIYGALFLHDRILDSLVFGDKAGLGTIKAAGRT